MGQCGCLKPMIDLLIVSDVKIVGVALDAIENILKCGKQTQQENGLGENPVVALVEHAGGLERIEALQEDPNEDVYQKAMRMLENYFPIADEDECATAGQSTQFQFGAEVPQGGFNFSTFTH